MTVLNGQGFSPVVVGIARAVVEGAVFGGLAVAAALLADLPAEYAAYGAAGLTALRTLEGYADQIDPQKRRANS